MCSHSAEPIQRVALVTDVRSGSNFETLLQALSHLKAEGQPCRILFLDCADEVLCRRFKETRRRHPLAGESDRVEDALAAERRLLQPLADRADYRLDTSRLNTSQLRQQVFG